MKDWLKDKPFTPSAIYAPNSARISFLENTFRKLQEFQEGAVILAGDFNFITNSHLDGSPRKHRAHDAGVISSTQLKYLINKFSLCDIW